MSRYIPRTLTYRDDEGKMHQVSDTDTAFFSSGRSLIVLGEPGMGKTRLLENLSKSLGGRFILAASFVHHPNPADVKSSNGLIIIDGLDELPANQDSDPVFRVLGQLIKAGSPPFILSCRAADWKSAIARREISREYKPSPYETTLQAFSSTEAEHYLSEELGEVQGRNIIHELDTKGVPDLYGNPQTLELIAKIAQNSGALPDTRVELFQRGVEILWQEQNESHERSTLYNIDQETALSAAGAICAAFILGGAEAISTKPYDSSTSRILSITEIASLPNAGHAPALLKSRLFCSTAESTNLFKPIHRRIAEFLGAKWLSSQAKDEQTRGRVLALMTIDGGVPASLRGIHAWLVQDRGFAPHVISNDPFGVLRYGDADGLGVDQARLLLQCLQKLQREDPYFRAHDWIEHSSQSLTRPELLDAVKLVLMSEQTEFHLRSLLLEAIKGSEIVPLLVTELRDIIFSDESSQFFFSDRSDAAEALIRHDSGNLCWAEDVERLIGVRTEDSTRLALDIINELGHDKFHPRFVARVLLAHIGLLDNFKGIPSSRSIGHLLTAARRMPCRIIPDVLDEIVNLLPDPERCLQEHNARHEISSFINTVVSRYISHTDPHHEKIYTWLLLAPSEYTRSSEEFGLISEYFTLNTEIRRKTQIHGLLDSNSKSTARQRLFTLQEANHSLSPTPGDVIYLLGELEKMDGNPDFKSEIWKLLVDHILVYKQEAEEIIEAAQQAAQGSITRSAYIAQLLETPNKTKSEIEHQKRLKQLNIAKRKRWTKHAESFTKNIAHIRTGASIAITPIARAYFGHFSEIDNHLFGSDRISHWLGEALQTAALEGFEAALLRKDYPSLREVALDFARGTLRVDIFASMAGIAERVRKNQGIEDISPDRLVSARLAIGQGHFPKNEVFDAFAFKLEDTIQTSKPLFELYARSLVESHLELGKTYIDGFTGLLCTEQNSNLIARLCLEWLERFPEVSNEIEIELMDKLISENKFIDLLRIFSKRNTQGFRNDEQKWNWTAASLMIDFENTINHLPAFTDQNKDFLWHIRHFIKITEKFQRSFTKFEPELLAWTFSRFRAIWPMTERPSGPTGGSKNSWDASNFLISLAETLAKDTSDFASNLLSSMALHVVDGYTPRLRHALQSQQQARREIRSEPVSLLRMKNALTDSVPETTGDLIVIVQFALQRLQKELQGSHTDPAVKYWRKPNKPQREDYCTDRMIEDLQRVLPAAGVNYLPQADMPNNKRSDIIVQYGKIALPIECKCQWNDSLWTAPREQLDELYLRDHRAQDRGIYLVYWFGSNVDDSDQLYFPKGTGSRPTTPQELKEQLINTIEPSRRSHIVVEVLDLTR